MDIMPQVGRMNLAGRNISPRWWAFLALAVLALLLVVPVSRASEGDAFGEELRNLGHVPLFALVAILLRFVLPSAPAWRSTFSCAAAASLLAVLTEVAQGFTGRTPSAGDLLADFSGILIACALMPLGKGRRAWVMRLLVLLAGCGMAVPSCRKLAVEFRAASIRREVFPVLMDPASPRGLWEPQGSTRLEVVDAGGHAGEALEVRMSAGSYEGLRYHVPESADARGYSGLRVETANPGAAFELGVRMDGERGARRYGSIMIPEGTAVSDTAWAATPFEGKPVRVVLFTGENQPARTIHLLDARLVRTGR